MNDSKSSPGSLRPQTNRAPGRSLAAPNSRNGNIGLMERSGKDAGAGPRPGNPGGVDTKIGQTIDYMLQHLNEQVQVAKLASLVNISPSHFFALFKRRTGCAPIDFFIRLRMQHACQLLDGTALNVKEVAAVLGYDDPFYFSRTFKAINQVAPSEYRMMPRKMKNSVKHAALLRDTGTATKLDIIGLSMQKVV
ncbi:MAG TPA: AraC family transcriptional regulator [Verrucomicrobiae bacterium]|nr:AraC family transcriptional regulator [Verrucomicrobiae bacterium]